MAALPFFRPRLLTSRWHPDSGEIIQELVVPVIKVLGRIGHELSAGRGASDSLRQEFKDLDVWSALLAHCSGVERSPVEARPDLANLVQCHLRRNLRIYHLYVPARKQR